MKNKTKVILGLAAMLAGTVGIAGVSTYAWFATQNTAKIGFTDAVVRGDTTDIAVEWTTVQPAGSNIAAGGGITINNSAKLDDLEIAGATTNIIDLSGDGYKFYHPLNYTTEANANGAYCTSVVQYLNNTSYGTTNYFMTFNVQVRNRGNVSTDVYMGQASTVSAADTFTTDAASIEAAKAARVAIWQLEKDATTTDFTKATMRTLWQPSDPTADPEDAFKYLSTEQLGTAPKAFNYTPVPGDTFNTQVYENTVDSTATTGVSSLFHAGAYTDQTVSTVANATDISGTTAETATLTSALATKGNFLCHLDPLKSKIINISMWIEGTDGEADVDCINGHIQLDLSLHGVARTQGA